jgi:hypothetical protein
VTEIVVKAASPLPLETSVPVPPSVAGVIATAPPLSIVVTVRRACAGVIQAKAVPASATAVRNLLVIVAPPRKNPKTAVILASGVPIEVILL